MRAVKDIFVSTQTPILEALQRIERGGAQIALVVDSDARLLGTVTDGDVRRGILRGVSLDAPVAMVMNSKPVTAPAGTTEEAVIALMRDRALHQVPILDDEGRVLDLITLDLALRATRADTIVVLMAGGLGSRLRPLTHETPKPLLPIGGRPLLEITISNLARQGFGRFFIAVNYKAEMFQHHFAEGEHLGVEINYLAEEERLGTAGALRLLPERPTSPLLMMNGDILTNLDGRQLLQFHREQGASATICVREYEWRIPYGVVQIRDDRLSSFEEKPTRREFVSAGIYVLSPESLEQIPKMGSIDMPILLAKIAENLGSPAIYPLREYWLDIGHFDDLQRAQSDIHLLQ